jgi:hypothetical protein
MKYGSFLTSFVSLVFGCLPLASSCAHVSSAMIAEHTSVSPNATLLKAGVDIIDKLKANIHDSGTRNAYCAKGENLLARDRVRDFLATSSSQIAYVRRVSEATKDYYSIHLDRKEKGSEGYRFFSVSIWFEDGSCKNYVLGVPTID